MIAVKTIMLSIGVAWITYIAIFVMLQILRQGIENLDATERQKKTLVYKGIDKYRKFWEKWGHNYPDLFLLHVMGIFAFPVAALLAFCILVYVFLKHYAIRVLLWTATCPKSRKAYKQWKEERTLDRIQKLIAHIKEQEKSCDLLDDVIKDKRNKLSTNKPYTNSGRVDLGWVDQALREQDEWVKSRTNPRTKTKTKPVLK